MEAATNTLRSMFPKSSADQCVSALKINNWDLSATIDYMLAQTATEEQQVQQKQVQQQVNPSIPPPPHTIPPPLPPQPANVVESEEDKLLKEFLFLEQQIQINRIPTPPPYNPSTNNNVAIKPSVAVVEKVEPISIPPPPPPPPQPIVHEHPPQQKQQQEQQEQQQEEEPKTRENNSLLRNITNTLKELENEVRNLVMEKKPSQSNVVETVESVETTEAVISNNDINNNNVAQNNIEQLAGKEQQVEQEQVEQEQVGEEQENNENNSNSNSQLPNEVKVAIDQLESLFNSSLEKTEKILNELKEEITSWKIKDNVKTFTVTVRNELSDILASLANYISPDQTEVQIQRKEAKRQELENKLKELKEHNRILEEERRIAIEKIENKYKQQQQQTTTTSSDNQIPPPPPYPEDNSEQ
ncbi:hypothetical protein ACTFIV_003318 [Dictyostelium citrinum]